MSDLSDRVQAIADSENEGGDDLYALPVNLRQPIPKTTTALTLAACANGPTTFSKAMDTAWAAWLKRPAPEEGVFFNVSFEDYCAINAMNISSLTWGVDGDMNEVRRAALFPMKATKNMRLGTSVHGLLMEPGVERVRRGPINPKTEACYGMKTKEWAKAQEAAGPGVTLMDEEGLEKATNMAEAATAHAAARKLIGDVGETEVVMVWRCPLTGIWCKARTDKLIRMGAVCVDYKSAADSSPGAFSRQLFNFNYYNQAAWYLWGLEVLAKKHRTTPGGSFVFIVGKSSSPFTVGTYEIGHKSLELGTHENKVLLGTFAKCLERNEWPGFGDNLRDVDVPQWVMNRYDEGYGIGGGA